MTTHSHDMTWVQGLVSFASASALMLLVPVAILIVVIPIVLAIRGVLELVLWLFGVQS